MCGIRISSDVKSTSKVLSRSTRVWAVVAAAADRKARNVRVISSRIRARMITRPFLPTAAAVLVRSKSLAKIGNPTTTTRLLLTLRAVMAATVVEKIADATTSGTGRPIIVVRTSTGIGGAGTTGAAARGTLTAAEAETGTTIGAGAASGGGGTPTVPVALALTIERRTAAAARNGDAARTTPTIGTGATMPRRQRTRRKIDVFSIIS